MKLSKGTQFVAIIVIFLSILNITLSLQKPYVDLNRLYAEEGTPCANALAGCLDGGGSLEDCLKVFCYCWLVIYNGEDMPELCRDMELQ